MATFRLILGFAIFLGLGLLGFKLVPPFFSNYQFEDALKTEAVQATYTTRTEEDVREEVIKQARTFDIALTPKQVSVVRIGAQGTGTLSIEANYSVPINLPGYTANLDFHPSSKNKGVY